jgi:glycosyltransferase involved in cell wall biosynthesis
LLPTPRRHGRRAVVPLKTADSLARRPIRLVITHEVVFRFRLPIFRRLAAHPALDVKILAGSGDSGTKLANAAHLDDLDVKILWTWRKYVVSTGRRVLLTINPSLPWHLFRLRPDVLLVQGGMLFNNLATLLYARVTGTPIVWWSLGEIEGRQFKGLSALYRRMVRWVERRATLYAGFSSVAINYFLKEGYPPNRCYNLVNVVDTEAVRRHALSCRDKIAPLRRCLGLEGQKVVLFVGSMTQTKGLASLLAAWARLRDHTQSVRLVLVGDGPERARCQRLAQDLGIADRVVFVGAVYDDVAVYFQLADLFVMPGTGGLAISDAMVHGLPVIAAIGDGVEVDLIDQGQNGFRIPPNDTEALTQALGYCLGHPERLDRMAAHSLAIIRERANIGLYFNEMLGAILHAHKLGRDGCGDPAR